MKYFLNEFPGYFGKCQNLIYMTFLENLLEKFIQKIAVVTLKSTFDFKWIRHISLIFRFLTFLTFRRERERYRDIYVEFAKFLVKRLRHDVVC